MHETKGVAGHEGHHSDHGGGDQRGVNAMGLLMAVAVAVAVAVWLVPGLGWPLGIGIAVLAGGVMLALQRSGVCGSSGSGHNHCGGC